MFEKKEKYYRLDRILKEKATYNVIFGERSNGKTFSVEDLGLEDFCKNGHQLAVIRRYEEDFRGKRGQTMFDAIVANGLVEKYTNNRWKTIVYRNSRWYLAKYDEIEDKMILDVIPFAYAFALNGQEHDKSTSYPLVRNILFDEFITRGSYLVEEFIIFTNVLSTIIRDRDDVRIFMLGNTVNKYCPYFAEMGLSNIDKMKQDEIEVYQYGDSGLTVAVEYSSSPQKKKKSDKYFAFNNPKLKMITNGVWEIAIYPHLPQKYSEKDILFKYFIQFDKYILQCEIININNNNFTYIHKKTTSIKMPDNDLVFSQVFDKRINWRRHIDKPLDDVGKNIWWFYKYDKVFYQDNEVGEIVRNYLNWCKNEIKFA